MEASYQNEVVDAIATRLRKFNGRMLFFDERLEVAREMAERGLFETSQLLDTVRQVLANDNKTIDCPVDYARFCVDWIANTPDSAEILFNVALDKKLAWYVREEAFHCIGALPSKDELTDEQWAQIAHVVRTETTTSSLWALVDQGVTETFPVIFEILAQLITKSPNSESRSWDEKNDIRHFTLAAAALGANDLIENVIEDLFASSYYHQRDAKRAFQQILNRIGDSESVASELLNLSGIEFDRENLWSQLAMHQNPAVVRWGMTQTPTSEDRYQATLVSRLGNADWGVRKEACQLLHQAWKDNEHFDQQPLWDLFNDQAAERIARSWAASTLLELDNSFDDVFPVETRNDVKEIWHTPWPFEVDPAIRHAVVLQYGRYSNQPGTDIRYRIEFEMYAQADQQLANADCEALVAALKESGIEASSILAADDHRSEGASSFWVIYLGDELDSNELNVSKVGRLLSYTYVARTKTENSSSIRRSAGLPIDEFEKEKHKAEKIQCESIARRLGYLVLERDLLKNVVPGLNVYHFGSREPLPLKDLIYFWQD